MQLDESLPVVGIPDVDDGIGAARGEGRVLRVEGQRVHRVDRFRSVRLFVPKT